MSQKEIERFMEESVLNAEFRALVLRDFTAAVTQFDLTAEEHDVLRRRCAVAAPADPAYHSTPIGMSIYFQSRHCSSQTVRLPSTSLSDIPSRVDQTFEVRPIVVVPDPPVTITTITVEPTPTPTTSATPTPTAKTTTADQALNAVTRSQDYRAALEVASRVRAAETKGERERNLVELAQLIERL